MQRGKTCLFLLPLILFLYLVLSESVERSMYTDGVAYAGLSSNLANGIGTFWTPSLSEVHLTRFHSHPPLVFGIQSLFFRVLGDGLATERIYAVVIFLLSAGLMVLLWREAFRGKAEISRLWFVPLTLWLANEIVYHYYPANVLEPTMTVFLLGAVYTMLRGLRPDVDRAGRYGTAMLAALLLFAATLCKGFVALFALATYALYWLIFRDVPLRRAVLLTLTLTGTLVAAYALLWQYGPAQTALWEYLEIQVLPSLNSERVWEPHFRSNRWYIIKRLFAVLLPSFLVTSLVAAAAYRWTRGKVTNTHAINNAFLFLSLGVAASFPLAISPKQSFYYLLPSMGFFALGFAASIGPAVARLMERRLSPRWNQVILVVSLLLVLGGILNTVRHWGSLTNRDREVLHDIDLLSTGIPAGTTVGSRGDIAELVSYFYRLHGVSIDTSRSAEVHYDLLIAKEDVPVSSQRSVRVRGERYILYGR